MYYIVFIVHLNKFVFLEYFLFCVYPIVSCLFYIIKNKKMRDVKKIYATKKYNTISFLYIFYKKLKIIYVKLNR